MNTIRNIEGATLISIGALCAAAVLSLAMQTAHAITSHQAVAANVPTVTIVARHASAAEKNAYRAELNNGHKMI
ncbi:MAG TPA: hypothetical protein VF472_01190 [Burkholderiaceae bacterium]